MSVRQAQEPSEATPATYRATATEAEVQAQIVEGLRFLGYRVLQTSRKRTRCHKCQSYSAADVGADRGIPDLLVTRDEWPVGVWLGLEVKGPRTLLSREQAELAETGRIVIVRSFEDARITVEAER